MDNLNIIIKAIAGGIIAFLLLIVIIAIVILRRKRRMNHRRRKRHLSFLHDTEMQSKSAPFTHTHEKRNSRVNLISSGLTTSPTDRSPLNPFADPSPSYRSPSDYGYSSKRNWEKHKRKRKHSHTFSSTTLSTNTSSSSSSTISLSRNTIISETMTERIAQALEIGRLETPLEREDEHEDHRSSSQSTVVVRQENPFLDRKLGFEREWEKYPGGRNSTSSSEVSHPPSYTSR